MSVKRLTKYQVGLVLDFLNDGAEDSIEIAKKLGITKMQVAAVKAWRTQGKY